MNNNFVCDEHYEAMVAMTCGILDSGTVKPLEDHIGNCLPCSGFYKNLYEEEVELRKAFKIITDRGKVVVAHLLEQLCSGAY